jgi:hypothetical protein
MRKVFLASFIAIMLVMVPITTASQTANVSYIKNIASAGSETTKFIITQAQRHQLDNYIETNFKGEEKDQAFTIANDIINSDLEVDPIKLAEAWATYGYQPIPQEEIDNAETPEALELLIEVYWLLNVFANLVLFITSLISSRLGWLFGFINEGLSLFVRGVGLIIESLYITFNLLKAFVSAVNQILTVPAVFAQALEDLFNQKYADFLITIGNFVGEFTLTFIDLLDALILLLIDFVRIVDYLKDTLGYFLWIKSEPWKEPILIIGVVRKFLFFPVVGATVTCKGKSTTTNDKGEFSFYVDPSPDETSIPPNEYYGMHKCVITVEKDGEVIKETPGVLSYVFSYGYIFWPFIIMKGRSKVGSFNYNLMERFSNLLERIGILLKVYGTLHLQGSRIYKLCGLL